MRAERVPMKRPQQGFFLLEALIAILIFSLGILGMVAMGSAAIAAQSDTRARTDAANLANDMASTIQLNVDRSNPTNLAASLTQYKHQPGGAGCAFTGDPSGNTEVQNWVNKVTTVGAGLPGLAGATANSQQITVDPVATDFNRVTITVCWQAPTDKAMRQYTLVTYVN